LKSKRSPVKLCLLKLERISDNLRIYLEADVREWKGIRRI